MITKENDFSSPQEEITLFKKYKPYVYIRLKFYAKLYFLR